MSSGDTACLWPLRFELLWIHYIMFSCQMAYRIIYYWPGYNHNYITNSQETFFLHVPLFLMVQRHPLQLYKYRLRYFCCQVTITITWMIPLRFIYITNSQTMLFPQKFIFMHEKRNPNPNFLVRISSGGVGVFHVKGWGPKSSVCPSKPRETKLFGGISRDFWRDIPGEPEKFEKNVCVQSLDRILISN